MIDTEAEISLSGALREHVIRIAFAFDIGTPARLSPGGPGNLSVSELDCGERGDLIIKNAWAVLMRDEKPVREKKLWPSILEKLRDDEKLEDFLHENALKELPDA